MTRNTHSRAIINIKHQVGSFSISDYMVGVQIASVLSTFLASITVPFKNFSTPLLIFITGSNPLGYCRFITYPFVPGDEPFGETSLIWKRFTLFAFRDFKFSFWTPRSSFIPRYASFTRFRYCLSPFFGDIVTLLKRSLISHMDIISNNAATSKWRVVAI